MKNKILLVEDEKNFGSILKQYLIAEGFDVCWCEDGEAGMVSFLSNSYELCLIDIMMPKMDGFNLISEIRKHNKFVPLLLLTSRSMREDMLKAYKLGADDYLIKPFDAEILLFKIKAVLNRNSTILNTSNAQYVIGNFTFNPKLRVLIDHNRVEQKLSPKESALLNLLCEKMNDVLPREVALRKIWKDDNYFTARSMDVYIVKLRKQLLSDNKIQIINVHGNGYSLQLKQSSLN
jgi:two-component system, OmpR family, response regulator